VEIGAMADPAPHPLAIDRPAVLTQLSVRAAIPPPRLALGDRAQLRAQISVIDTRRARRVALSRSVLPRQPTGPTLAEVQAVAKHRDRPTPAGRAQKFPRAISLSPSMSSA
jgi:hypothetical protein